MQENSYYESYIPVRLHERAKAEALRDGELDLASRRTVNAERGLLGLRERRSPLRQTKWVAQLHLLEGFVFETARLPSRHSNNSDERSHYRWLVAQRNATDLSVFQSARLRVSPAFASAHSANWKVRAAQTENFIAKHGRLPRLRADYSDEFRLARWVNRQVQASRAGRLPARERQVLATLVEFSVSQIRGRITNGGAARVSNQRR